MKGNMKIAIQGSKGSYSEEAAGKMLGSGFEIISFPGFRESFNYILQGKADYGVFPIENKIIGKIEQVIVLLRETNLKIHDRLGLEIRHTLIGTPEARVQKVEFVYSQREALLQCKKFFLRNPGLKMIEGPDTASSVREVMMKGLPKNAAIASKRAAEVYGGKVLCEDIADEQENWTLFCLVGR
jgi:prephenate dehydratase